MGGMEWNESLLIGVKLIDDQHRKWVGHLNDVSESIATRRGPERIAETLGFLIDYTETHFATEERHMSATGYPELEDHRALHESLRGTLADLVRDYRDEGPTRELADAVDTFLVNWLRKHIQDVDHRFGVYLREQNIELTDSQET